MTVTLPIMFLFQNCNRSTSFEEAPSVVMNNSICESVDNVQGDMRVLFTRKSGEPSTLEFGTVANNYWTGDQTGKIYDRRLEMDLTNISEITHFSLENIQFDDWLNLKINGQFVYNAPRGGDRLEREDGRVRYSANQLESAELGFSWNISPRMDLKPFLVEGHNVFELRTIVAGGGEGYMKILVSGGCSN